MPKPRKAFRFFRRRNSRKSNKTPASRYARYWRVAGFALLFLLIVDIGYLYAIWPNWEKFAQGTVAKSQFIEDYEKDRLDDQRLPPLQWKPIAYRAIPAHMIRAVIVAEDAKFYRHEGVDVEALKDAIEYNWEKGRIVYGSSTISQQTVKNLLLSRSRNPLRKLHEYVLTFSMENNLSKKRILELYLNIVEFGPGVFGIDAAAKHYWGVRASNLTTLQSIELAATLPAPVKHNPKTRTKFFMKRVDKIKRQFGYHEPEPTAAVPLSTEQPAVMLAPMPEASPPVTESVSPEPVATDDGNTAEPMPEGEKKNRSVP